MTRGLLQALALLGLDKRVLWAAGEADSWGLCDALESDGPPSDAFRNLLDPEASGSFPVIVAVGADLLAGIPSSEVLRRRIAAAETLIVVDRFASETASFAHVVLPSCAFGEVDGCLTNAFGTVQRWRGAIPPAGDALPERVWAQRLAQRLGFDSDFSSAEAIRGALDVEGAQWGCVGLGQLLDHSGPAGAQIHEPTILQFGPMPAPAPLDRPDGFPLRLAFRSHPAVWSSGQLSAREPLLRREVRESLLYASPADLQAAGLKTGGLARVAAPHASAVLRIREESGVPAGTVLATVLPWSEAWALRGCYPDAPGGGVAIQPVPARLEKV